MHACHIGWVADETADKEKEKEGGTAEKERAEKEKGTRSSRSAGANVLAFATFSCRGEKTPASRLRLLEAVNLQQYDGPR